MTKTDFNNKLTNYNRRNTNKTKHLEFQKRINSLITNDYIFFLGRMYFTSNDESQNMFGYQPTLATLELKDEYTDNVLSSKSNGVYNSELKPLYTAFLHSIKLSGYRMKIKFDKVLLAVKQKKLPYQNRKCLHRL